MPAHIVPVSMVRILEKALEAKTRGTGQVKVSLFMVLSAGSGILGLVLMVIIVGAGTSVSHVPRQGSWESNISLRLMIVLGLEPGRSFSTGEGPVISSCGWMAEDFLRVHRLVRESGKFNFQGCRIPVPTAIRYDRIREALGSSVTGKHERVLCLLEFGMPLDCEVSFGVKKPQKNHFSAISFKKEVSQYFNKGTQSKALLGPFKSSPIPELCYSPLMSVPKEDFKRRIIVDFSFPPGNAINDGIPKTTYLEFQVEFSLPSVRSMVDRLNELGKGCLLYKRDLKGAFRQFNIDPGDYRFTGLKWDGDIYIDTRLAMGLRSAAFCCQSVTEIVANIARQKAFVLVYLDDFGGAELVDKAHDSFNHLGWLLEHFGLEEAPDKAVSPTTKMDWLGISFDTVEWTMALKPGKLQELLGWLPKLLNYRRVKKVLLQKILGNLVWASAVVRAGVIFFNRLLVLLRKLKRSNHSIYFSKEAKKDVAWWLAALSKSQGKTLIPPSIWTPLVSFHTDASLDGFGMVWGSRAMAGLFPLELEERDINCKEMLTVMLAIKHWFGDLANLKVKIYVDNQACVALLNYGITKSPFLAACLREICFVLAKFNIELRAEYIPSKDNCLADLCSRAFCSEKHFKNFNQLLFDKVLILENVYYDKFQFELDL